MQDANNPSASRVSPDQDSSEVGSAQTSDDASEPGSPNDAEELRRVLRSFQRLVVRYPFAAQALFASLVAEGRQFAETSVGQQWVARLAPSELMRQGRAVWEAVTLNALEADPDAILPSKYLEAFVATSKRLDLEAFLTSIFEQERAPSTAASEDPASRDAPDESTSPSGNV